MSFDLTIPIAELSDQGYTVIEGMLGESELEEVRAALEQAAEQDRKNPFDPGETETLDGDAAIEAFLAESYSISKQELRRIMRQIRHTRAQNYGTPWPLPIAEVPRNFVQLANFTEDGTQYVRNLPVKNELFLKLMEDARVLALTRSVLGDDCILSDLSANILGPHTAGQSWHVDAPLQQLPDPLPEFALTTQSVWMIDDFTHENGATRLVPGSHRKRRKPTWVNEVMEDEISLEAPAGSLAIWSSNTWHRAGANTTDRCRRAVLGYYARSWVKPFTDYRPSITSEMAERMSPTARYLLGFSSNAVPRA